MQVLLLAVKTCLRMCVCVCVCNPCFVKINSMTKVCFVCVDIIVMLFGVVCGFMGPSKKPKTDIVNGRFLLNLFLFSPSPLMLRTGIVPLIAPRRCFSRSRNSSSGRRCSQDLCSSLVLSLELLMEIICGFLWAMNPL